MEEHDDVMMGDVSDVIDVTPRGVSKRRANKHLIERRRRARINCSLTQLKTLVLEGMRKDPARYTRLEKADVLELTVTHLKTVRNQRDTESSTADPQLSSRYKAGFFECAQEISRFLLGLPEMEEAVRTNIITHLEECMQHASNTSPSRLPASGERTGSDVTTGSAKPGRVFEENCSTQPLDLSVAGAGRTCVEMEEMECYTIHKYGSASTSDVESVASSQEADLHDNVVSRADVLIGRQGARQSCAESLDSGLDDAASSTTSSVESHELRIDGSDGCYQVEDEGMQSHDDPMWRPW